MEMATLTTDFGDVKNSNRHAEMEDSVANGVGGGSELVISVQPTAGGACAVAKRFFYTSLLKRYSSSLLPIRLMLHNAILSSNIRRNKFDGVPWSQLIQRCRAPTPLAPAPATAIRNTLISLKIFLLHKFCNPLRRKIMFRDPEIWRKATRDLALIEESLTLSESRLLSNIPQRRNPSNASAKPYIDKYDPLEKQKF
ncbi:hypothetical protein EVAR_584_1 [Eumeta japonica]|uniref:Uncharacterized protein n=1 Tax=Eumeta variegata TaxID=151549 RepID=A0A4C1SAZ7_EUMVA|nr:hypothetical protein EVAR_584_1 [Eumeta japonica]